MIPLSSLNQSRLLVLPRWWNELPSSVLIVYTGSSTGLYKAGDFGVSVVVAKQHSCNPIWARDTHFVIERFRGVEYFCNAWYSAQGCSDLASNCILSAVCKCSILKVQSIYVWIFRTAISRWKNWFYPPMREQSGIALGPWPYGRTTCSPWRDTPWITPI